MGNKFPFLTKIVTDEWEYFRNSRFFKQESLTSGGNCTLELCIYAECCTT